MKNKLIKFLKLAKDYIFGGTLSRVIVKLERIQDNLASLEEKGAAVASISNIFHKESTIKKYGSRPLAVYREFTTHADLSRLIEALKSINAPTGYNLNNAKVVLDASVIEACRPKIKLETNGESIRVIENGAPEKPSDDILSKIQEVAAKCAR